MKRFYTSASVTGEQAPFGIALDTRPVRTPARAPLELPNRVLAGAIAEEWNSQGEQILPRTMPLTGLSNAALDRVAPDTTAFADSLAIFAENELLTYRADSPDPLVTRQMAEWDPWLNWARQRYDIDFTLITGIIHQPQPPATLTRITAAYRAFTAFQLAALNPVVTISGSAILGLAVAEAGVTAEAAWTTSHLDELWQAEQWGTDPLAEAGHNERRADLTAAVRMLRLLEQGVSQ